LIVVGKLFQPTPSFPALQFLDSIEKSSNAAKAGLKQNDYVLEVSFRKQKLIFYSSRIIDRSMVSMSFPCHMKIVLI
jgi:hypothetical protein